MGKTSVDAPSRSTSPDPGKNAPPVKPGPEAADSAAVEAAVGGGEDSAAVGAAGIAAGAETGAAVVVVVVVEAVGAAAGVKNAVRAGNVIESESHPKSSPAGRVPNPRPLCQTV